MSDSRQPWVVITDQWESDHPGWEVVVHHPTMITVSVFGHAINGVVVRVRNVGTGDEIPGLGSDIVSALNDVNRHIGAA